MAQDDRSQVIRYYDRRKKMLATEEVYGDRWLRWTYQSSVGRLALWALVKRSWFSRHYGRRMSTVRSRSKIAPFIRDYGLDISEFADPPEAFRTFNEFFIRRLKPEARPIDPDPSAVVFPADGRHLVLPDIAMARSIYAKGQSLDLDALVPKSELAALFRGGSMAISRLCPVDYHRFHFPVSGRVGDTGLIDGPLYSVNPIALRRSLEYLVRNKRVWTLIESTYHGNVLMIEIGATCVGSIVQTFDSSTGIPKGGEKGYFAFGGSCVITLFERGKVRFDPDLIEQSRQSIETYAHMGERMGSVGGASAPEIRLRPTGLRRDM
ncbi:MAG: phosphatidylserine decarboxylase [Verrucomicrobia bacterium]|nr:MAG: phosphatidylserine decarboxylase [Verrucomicrobiota bacterium]